MTPYYLISLSGAYDSQSFWKAKDSDEDVNEDSGAHKPKEHVVEYGNDQSSDCIYIDCTDVPGSLYFCSDEARDELTKRLSDVPVNALHFIDSGDYHYVSLLFLQRIAQPFSLLLFDHHSDCMESAFGGDLLTCGSWVLRALNDLPNLKRAILVGPADEDGTAGQLLADSRITWVTEEEFDARKEELHEALLEYPVYVSLDKDVLDPKEAVTDWSQGSMKLSDILDFFETAKASGTLFLGMDVCGEQKVSEEASGAGTGAQTNSNANETIVTYQKDLTFSLYRVKI